jgi:hypothetical protein
VFRVSFSKRWVMGIINMIMFISLIYFISHKSNYPVVLGRYSTAAFAAIIISTLSFFISILVFIYFNNIVSYLNTKLKKTMGLIKIGNLLLFLIIWSIVSLILAGSGEFNRYTIILFPFVVFLIAKYSINYSKKLVVLLLLMTIIPTIYSSLLMFDHFRRSTTFLSKLHFPTALEIKNSKGINSVAVWETGIISYFLSNEKKIIDIYGLGTTRYAILNHGFRLDKLKQFLNDKPDALVSWSSSLTPEPGLDENNGISIKKHFTVSLDSQIYYMKNNYPQKMSTYLLTYR